jgi:hypothetical protein
MIWADYATENIDFSLINRRFYKLVPIKTELKRFKRSGKKPSKQNVFKVHVQFLNKIKEIPTRFTQPYSASSFHESNADWNIESTNAYKLQLINKIKPYVSICVKNNSSPIRNNFECEGTKKLDNIQRRVQ